MLDKIKMEIPLVEIDGDEMARIMWHMVKTLLLEPYIDLKTDYYDLGIQKRDETDDQITIEAAYAIKKYGVGVKCATITPNTDRVKEYKLKKAWSSPNGTIRSILDGTVFRTPILVKSIKPTIKTWSKPVTIARHAYGDIYRDVEYIIEEPGKAELVFTSNNGVVSRQIIHVFKKPGIILGMYNLTESIENFARACFEHALYKKQNIMFSTKDTVSKKYDHTFKNIFQEIFNNEYLKRFEETGISYSYTLIDDAVAQLVRSEGGFIWACKNYDGDVMSDLVASANGSLAMMTSVLVSPQGYYEYEAAHGTVQRHYYRYLKGLITSTNPIAIIFAWTGALRKRGQLDGINSLVKFADQLEDCAIKTIDEGFITKDLASISNVTEKHILNTEEFLIEIGKCLNRTINKIN